MGLPVIFDELKPEYWAWIKQRAKPVLCEDTRGFVALRGDRVVGAVVFDNWSPNACMAHIAIEDPFILRRGFLELCAEFVFEYAGREVILGLVAADNEDVLRFDKHIGFTELCRIPAGYHPDVDYVLLQMRRETCRWLKPMKEAA